MQCPALPSSASQVDHPCSLHILSLSASVLLFVQIHHLPLNRLLCPPAEGAGSFHKGSRVAAPLLHRGGSFHTCWPARAQTWAEGALYLVLSFQVAKECHVLCPPCQWHLPCSSSLHSSTCSTSFLSWFALFLCLHHILYPTQRKPHTSLCPPVPGFFILSLFLSHLKLFL